MNCLIFTRTHLSNPLSRRTFIGSAAGATLAIAIGSPAIAFSENEARAMIDRAVGEITKIINSGKSESAMLRDFEGVFARYADRDVIGQLVLGPDGRSASAKQKSDFAKAFQRYISRKYGRRFREFIGGRVEVSGARTIKNFFEITTTAHLTGSAPFRVDFVVASQSRRFIDMKIEGISLVKAERAEIGAMLDKRGGDLNALISHLGQLG